MPLSPHVIVLMGRKYVAPTNRSAVTPITELCDKRFSRTLDCGAWHDNGFLTTERRSGRLQLLVGP